MIISETRRLFQKLFILSLLVAGLGLVSAGVGAKANTQNNKIPCCSYCDEHLGAPICSHGCSDSCRTDE